MQGLNPCDKRTPDASVYRCRETLRHALTGFAVLPETAAELTPRMAIKRSNG